MKDALFDQMNMKLRNKWHFVEHKAEIMQHDLKMQNVLFVCLFFSFFLKCIKLLPGKF